MVFGKIRSIKVSERVFDLVCEELGLAVEQNYVKVGGFLETFYNRREQGYVLYVYSTDYGGENLTREHLYIWVFEAKYSNDIVVCWQNKYPDYNMYSVETCEKRRKFFKNYDYFGANKFIVDLIKKQFASEFKGR